TSRKKIMNGIKIEQQCYGDRNISFPLSSSSMELNETTTSTEEDDEEEENEIENELLLKKTHDSGFVDVSDEKEVKKGIRSYSNYTSTPLRLVTNNVRKYTSESSSINDRHLSSDDTKFEDGKSFRNTRFLGSTAVAILNTWFYANQNYPYPDDEKTEQLAFETATTLQNIFSAASAAPHPSCVSALSLPSPMYQYQFQNSFFNPMLMNPIAMMMMMNPMYAQQLLSTAAANGSVLSAPTSPIIVPTSRTKQRPTSNMSATTFDKSKRFWM
ncbi:unnamed protein product, partial [Didymodactylos carnosus]